jgi:hypothetical protein
MSTRELGSLLGVPYPRALDLRHSFQILCRTLNHLERKAEVKDPNRWMEISFFRDRDAYVALGVWRPTGNYRGRQLAPGYPAYQRVRMHYLEPRSKSWFVDRPELLPLVLAPWQSRVHFHGQHVPPFWIPSLEQRGMTVWFETEPGGGSATRLWDYFCEWRKRISRGKDHRENRNLYAQEFVFRVNRAGKKKAAIQRELLDCLR